MSQTHSLRPGSIYLSFINSVWSLFCWFLSLWDVNLSFNILLTPGICPVSIYSLGLIRNVHYGIQTPNKALYTCVRVFESTCTKSPLNCSYQWQIYDTIPSNLSKGQDSIFMGLYLIRGLDPNQVISTTICLQNNL